MKKINSFYVIIFLLFGTLLAVNNYFFKGSTSFLGITYSKQYKINTEKPAIILATYVVPGQTVEPGDLLIELESPELTLEIEKLKKEIQLLNSEKEEKSKLLSSKIQLLESEKTILNGEIENEIRLLQNEIDLNNSLTGQILKNQNNEALNDTLTGLHLQIKSIKEKGLLELKALDIRLLDIKQEFTFDQSQIQAKVELAQEELNWKHREEQRLDKYATFSGVIENVYVKPGEQIEAFTSVISINSKHPSSVVGYLVGKKDRDKKLGDHIIVRSLEHPQFEIPGSIIGFGSVVELPEILQKSTSVKAFGLEVFIEVSEENQLAVGEKIIVK